MKICDLTQSYTLTSGGVKTYINEKKEYIRKNTDWSHILIIPGDKNSAVFDERSITYQIAAPLIPRCKPYRIAFNFDYVLRILEREKPDIIELGCAYTLPWIAYKYRQSNKVGIVGFYHTDFPSTYVESFISPVLGKKSAYIAKTISEQYAKYIYNKCDLAIAPSEILRKKLIDCGIKNPACVPLGVNTKLFNPVRRDISVRERLDIADDELMLIYSGRIDHEKRIDILIKAFEKLPGELKAKFVLIGDGPLRKELESSQNETKGLIILPYVSDKLKLAYLLSAADIYVTAGPFETFGLSVLEAQSSGLPVVGVRSGALLERVPPSVGVLGEVDSAEDLARNITLLYKNGYRDKGKEARKMVEREYSWDSTYCQLFEHYCMLTSAL